MVEGEGGVKSVFGTAREKVEVSDAISQYPGDWARSRSDDDVDCWEGLGMSMLEGVIGDPGGGHIAGVSKKMDPLLISCGIMSGVWGRKRVDGDTSTLREC